MAKSRMVSADIRTDEEVNSWPIELRYFWVMLWGYVDDFGRGRYNPRLVKADMFPLDDEATAERVGRWLHALELAGRIRVYEVDGERFFDIPTWSRWQKLSRPTASKIPEFPSFELSEHVNHMSSHVNHMSSHVSAEQIHGQGEGEIEIEGEGEGVTDAPPPPHCGKHSENSDEPCGACKRARLRREQWDRDHQPPPPEAMWDCAKNRHKWVAGNTCALCGEIKEAG